MGVGPSVPLLGLELLRRWHITRAPGNPNAALQRLEAALELFTYPSNPLSAHTISLLLAAHVPYNIFAGERDREDSVARPSNTSHALHFCRPGCIICGRSVAAQAWWVIKSNLSAAAGGLHCGHAKAGPLSRRRDPCQGIRLSAQVVYAVRECQRQRHMAVVCAAVPEPPKPATATAPLRSAHGDLFPTNDFFDPVMTGTA